MKHISNRIRRIYKDYYAKKAKARFESLVEYSQYFLKSLPIAEKAFCRVDLQKMSALIDSYFLDVIRFKDYHFRPSEDVSDEDVFSVVWNNLVHRDKYLSPSKVAAFEAKWILKYSPLIIIPQNDADFTDEDRIVLCSANALLAFQFSLTSMGLNPEDVDEDIARNMIYHFRFRHFDDRAFILQYDTLLKLAEVKGIVPYEKSDTLAKSSREHIPTATGVEHSRGIGSSKIIDVSKRRREDDNTYSVFIACPEDCDKLKNYALEGIHDFNREIHPNNDKLIPYFWTLDKKPGYQPGNFQENAYAEAKEKWGKSECDILIMNFWYKFGAYTAEEYTYFIEEFGKNNGGLLPHFLFCKFEKPISPSVAASNDVHRLHEWIKERKDDWVEIDPNRGKVCKFRDYSRLINLRIRQFMNEVPE